MDFPAPTFAWKKPNRFPAAVYNTNNFLPKCGVPNAQDGSESPLSKRANMVGRKKVDLQFNTPSN